MHTEPAPSKSNICNNYEDARERLWSLSKLKFAATVVKLVNIMCVWRWLIIKGVIVHNVKAMQEECAEGGEA